MNGHLSFRLYSAFFDKRAKKVNRGSKQVGPPVRRRKHGLGLGGIGRGAGGIRSLGNPDGHGCSVQRRALPGYVGANGQRGIHQKPNELYDLKSDAGERNNLDGSAEHAEVQRQLKSRLDRFFQRYADLKWDLWRGGKSKAGLITAKLFESSK